MWTNGSEMNDKMKDHAAKKRDGGKCRLKVNGVTEEPSTESRHCPRLRDPQGWAAQESQWRQIYPHKCRKWS